MEDIMRRKRELDAEVCDLDTVSNCSRYGLIWMQGIPAHHMTADSHT